MKAPKNGIYNFLIISVIAFALISSIAVWAWYNHKDAEIETQLLHIK